MILSIFLSSTSYAQPVIEFDSESYHAETITQGDIVEHNFGFTNAGDEDLVIEKITSP